MNPMIRHSLKVSVLPYDNKWVSDFETLREQLSIALAGLDVTIEHVGSTAVPGLSAKPVIDIDVVRGVYPSIADIAARLEAIGYRSRGQLGISGREAFRAPPDTRVRHHLYVCASDSLALKNHRLLRDRLRRDAGARDRYGKIKAELAERFADAPEDYSAGKTAFIVRLLAEEGLSPEELREISAENAPLPR